MKIAEFQIRLESLKEELASNNLTNFPKLNIIASNGIVSQQKLFIDWLDCLNINFNERFEDFRLLQNSFNFALNPFDTTTENLIKLSNEYGIDYKDLNEEIIKIKAQKIIDKDRFKNKIEELKKTLHLKKLYAKIVSMFSSSYLCEKSFS